MHEELPPKAPKLLRRIVTGEPAVTGFVEPFRFEDNDSSRLERLLEEHAAGDSEGRRLLIAASEYEIGLCLDAGLREATRESEPEIAGPIMTKPEDSALPPIASAARTLSGLLQASPRETAQRIQAGMSAADPLGRSYGEGFLCCLVTELERLADCCSEGISGDEPCALALPEPMRNFLQQMQDIYTECLEIEPTAAADGTFYQYLSAITALVEIGPLPGPQVLGELLALKE